MAGTYLERGEELVQKFFKAEKYYGGIKLQQVSEVPLALSQLEHIRRLDIEFNKREVTLPDWFYKLRIDHLIIKGELAEQQEIQLRRVFGERVSINPAATPAVRR